MKALTINIHSHFDQMDSRSFCNAIITITRFIIHHSIDVIAIQECSQTLSLKEIKGTSLGSFVSYEKQISIREDNCAYLIANELKKQGYDYEWTWTGIKLGYGQFDEGIAILTKHKILSQETAYISNDRDYNNWKVRKILGIEIEFEKEKIWFYSTHMGWWQDEDEPFVTHMDRLDAIAHNKVSNVFLMGDFNSQADRRGEGYDYIKKLGWKDTFELAAHRDEGITVPGTIDGWKDVSSGIRIDYIFSKNEIEVKNSQVVFNGEKEAEISDHFGVMITI